jgi:hypothetical protein
MSRREAYEAAAHCTIDTSLLSQGDAVEVLTAAISAHFEWNRPN